MDLEAGIESKDDLGGINKQRGEMSDSVQRESGVMKCSCVE